MREESRLIATLRNEREMKLDLLRNNNGWYKLRLWRTRDDGASAQIKEISLTRQELVIAIAKIEASESATSEMERTSG